LAYIWGNLITRDATVTVRHYAERHILHTYAVHRPQMFIYTTNAFCLSLIAGCFVHLGNW